MCADSTSKKTQRASLLLLFCVLLLINNMVRSDFINLLPKELSSDVFTRLPAKSLGQCKCVSKTWKALISDPDFIQTHLARSSITKLILISVISDAGALYSADFVRDYRYSYINPNCRNHLVNFPAYKRKLNFNLSNKLYRVWGSCDGLVLVEENGARPSMLVLNPTTLEARKLPLLPRRFYNENSSNHNVFGLGYDSSCDDYAVIAYTYNYEVRIDAPVHVFMLKTKHWKRVGFSPFDHKHQKGVAGIFLKGSLHWLMAAESSIIAAFNIAEKEFSGVPLPVGVFDSSSELPRLGVLKGRLCLFFNVINNISQLYVMKEYGVVESWTKFSVVLCDVSRVASLNLLDDSSGLPEGGPSVLLVSSAYDDASVESMKVLGLPNDFRVGMTFTESLVSPNKDRNKKTPGRKSKTKLSPRQYRDESDDISGWLKAW